MPEVIIVEPDITDEENHENWEKVQQVINLIYREINKSEQYYRLLYQLIQNKRINCSFKR